MDDFFGDDFYCEYDDCPWPPETLDDLADADSEGRQDDLEEGEEEFEDQPEEDDSDTDLDDAGEYDGGDDEA